MSVGAFLWGSGGRRMTAEDIARERAAASQRMRTDYSPVQSPWQGLARVADNLMGAVQSRRADSASTANSEDQRRIIEALMNPGGASPIAGDQPPAAPSPLDAGPAGMEQVGGTVAGLSDTPAPAAAAPAGRPAINPAIIEALTSPYVSDEVRALAGRQYTETTRRIPPIEINGRLIDPRTLQVLGDYSNQPEIVRIVRASGLDPESEQGRAMIRRYTENRADPVVSIPLPDGRTYVGPRSGMPGAIGRGGGAPPSTLPPDFDFPEEGGPQASSSADDFRGGAPVANAASVARDLFPGVRVTDNRRSATSRLGRANPGSWHVRSGGAVDVAPIRGMTFDQYVRRYRDAGYRILEQRDEVTNPSDHATGPHWHVVVGR